VFEVPRCLGVEGQVDAEGDECIENMDEESCSGLCSWFEDDCVDILLIDPDENPGSGDEYIDSISLTNINNKLECESNLEEYTWFGNNIIDYNSNAYEYEFIDIIAGNIPPQTPTGVNAESYNPEDDPASAWVTLTWDETEECCQTIESRYPATHYYIYRVLTADADDESTPEIDETEVWAPQLINNCTIVSPGDGPVIDTWRCLNDSSGDGICNCDEHEADGIIDDCVLIDDIYCDQYRYLYKGIVPADQFVFVDSTLDLRALGFLDKLIDMPDICEDNQDDLIDNCIYEEDVPQWKFDNARFVFETEFRYVITAVNEDFPNSENIPLSVPYISDESGIFSEFGKSSFTAVITYRNSVSKTNRALSNFHCGTSSSYMQLSIKSS
jgi:hypothetical protein